MLYVRYLHVHRYDDRLVEAVARIFGQIANGTFVFMVGGLQLIVAFALDCALLFVVYHCVAKSVMVPVKAVAQAE